MKRKKLKEMFGLNILHFNKNEYNNREKRKSNMRVICIYRGKKKGIKTQYKNFI